MDETTRRSGAPERTDDVSAAFAAFSLAHAGCEVVETRLDRRTLACRCLRCGETAVFGSPERHSRREG